MYYTNNTKAINNRPHWLVSINLIQAYFIVYLVPNIIITGELLIMDSVYIKL